MIEAITGIDHALVGVRDLEGARAAWTRLGFTLTPRGSHMGWGTANYCIMFASDYVELLGIVDAAKFTNRLDRFLERREGLMGLAFATGDAGAVGDALGEAGIGAGPVKDLARNLELPEGTVQPRFRLVHLPPDATPGVPAFVCQHLSPELVRRPEWLDHANGARAVSAVTVIVEDPGAVVEPYARLFGRGALAPTDAMVTLRVGGAAIVFARAEDLALIFSEAAPEPLPEPPAIVGMTVSVDDPEAAARLLEATGVAHVYQRHGAVVVPAGQATGVALELARPDAAGG